MTQPFLIYLQEHFQLLNTLLDIFILNALNIYFHKVAAFLNHVEQEVF